MIVELRSTLECPNVAPVRAALLAVLAELGLPIQVIELVGDHPSPSVLVNGVDVMGAAVDGQLSACRLDLPTVDDLRMALRRAMADELAPARHTVQDQADCCAPPPPGIGVDRPRRAGQLSGQLRTLYRAILRHFATTGTALGCADTDALGGADGDRLLAELHERDLIRLDAQGAILAAYPFSAVPTIHLVEIGARGPTVYAMCAIDALGVGAMLQRATVVHSTDPTNHVPITITLPYPSGDAAWSPATAVVFAGSTAAEAFAHAPCPAAERTCRVVNFFSTPDSAAGWQTTHPKVQGQVLTQARALRLGAETFGPLLHP